MAVPSFRRCSSRARLRPPGRISPGQRSSDEMSPRAANGGITDMMTYARPLLALVLLLGTAPRARAATSPSEGEAQAIGRTPPRLSYINGEVSFLRPGAQDWSPAQANTPLAPGDELYTSTQGDLEMQ